MGFHDFDGDEDRDQSMGTSRTNPSGWDLSLGSTPKYGRRPRTPDTQRDITVTAVNGQGFKTAEGDWINISKFARPEACPMPNVGETVRVLVDKAGYIRKISSFTVPPIGKVITSPAPAPAAIAPAEAPAQAIGSTVLPIAEPEPTPPVEPPAFVGRIEQDARGTVITRLAVLNSATAVLSSGGRVADADAVLALAAILENWATR